VVDEVLELVEDHLAGLVGPGELVLGVEHERQLVHLRLVERVGLRVDVRRVDADVPRRAAQPLPAVLPAHVLALRQRLPRQRLRVPLPRLRRLLAALRRRHGRRLGLGLLLLHLLLLRLGARRREPDATRRLGAREPAPLRRQLGRGQERRGRHACGRFLLGVCLAGDGFLCLFLSGCRAPQPQASYRASLVPLSRTWSG
jgi:hypothetical protein